MHISRHGDERKRAPVEGENLVGSIANFHEDDAGIPAVIGDGSHMGSRKPLVEQVKIVTKVAEFVESFCRQPVGGVFACVSPFFIDADHGDAQTADR